MIVADQLVAHAIGDYVIQSDWMANEKTKSWLPAIAHGLTYMLPFLFLTTSWQALAFIAGTHIVIDHWRLARYVNWFKNFLAPPTKTAVYKTRQDGDDIITTTEVDHYKRAWHHPWAECTGTGYHKDKPAWLTVWLMIITDNTMHVLCNGLAIYWWGTGA
jgi:hypothetical protein